MFSNPRLLRLKQNAKSRDCVVLLRSCAANSIQGLITILSTADMLCISRIMTMSSINHQSLSRVTSYPKLKTPTNKNCCPQRVLNSLSSTNHVPKSFKAGFLDFNAWTSVAYPIEPNHLNMSPRSLTNMWIPDTTKRKVVGKLYPNLILKYGFKLIESQLIPCKRDLLACRLIRHDESVRSEEPNIACSNELKQLVLLDVHVLACAEDFARESRNQVFVEHDRAKDGPVHSSFCSFEKMLLDFVFTGKVWYSVASVSVLTPRSMEEYTKC